MAIDLEQFDIHSVNLTIIATASKCDKIKGSRVKIVCESSLDSETVHKTHGHSKKLLESGL